ncbi:hypothetical protein [Streptomyces sp. NPDC046860]|uniref:hypothetical protein n=1 Tax=Streptomyces sp. NPDC046860 TaxID=3154495 RepID=UPI00340C446E
MSPHLSGATPPAETPTGPVQPYAAYEMRPLRTDADWAEAAALVTDRLEWLARKYAPRIGAANVPQLSRETSVPVGLYDDGLLVCCLMLDRDPDTRRWGREDGGPALLLRHVYTLPGQGGMGVARLLTMWAADFAARSGLPWVRVEALLAAGTATPAEVVAHLIEYVAALGWTSLGTATGSLGERVTRLHRPAEHIPTLTVAIHCTVPLTEFRSTS